MSQVDEFHWHTLPETNSPVVYPTSKNDCPVCKGHPHTYDGGKRWAVRWSEIGREPTIRQGDDEADARSLYGYLLRRYAELGRDDKPELLSTDITWTETQ